MTADLLEGFHGFAEPVLEILPSLGLYGRAVGTSPDPPLKRCQVSVSECASEAQTGVVLQDPGCNLLMMEHAMRMRCIRACIPPYTYVHLKT